MQVREDAAGNARVAAMELEAARSSAAEARAAASAAHTQSSCMSETHRMLSGELESLRAHSTLLNEQLVKYK